MHTATATYTNELTPSRLIVRRQPTRAGDQLSFDDVDGWRFHTIVTNITAGPANEIEAHHRQRGGIPEDTIRQLKHDFGLDHAPLTNFFGNWLWWHACALAHNTARWLERLALPREFRRSRGKRLRLAFFNVAARVVSHARRIWLRIPRSHAWADAFIEALSRVRTLRAYA
jgi:DDE family transposase